MDPMSPGAGGAAEREAERLIAKLYKGRGHISVLMRSEIAAEMRALVAAVATLAAERDGLMAELRQRPDGATARMELASAKRRIDELEAEVTEWRSVFGHLGKPDEAGNKINAKTAELEAEVEQLTSVRWTCSTCGASFQKLPLLPNGVDPQEEITRCSKCVEVEVLGARYAALRLELREAAADKERLDWLERELKYEQQALAVGLTPAHSLFRRNLPITRTAIDDIRHAAAVQRARGDTSAPPEQGRGES